MSLGWAHRLGFHWRELQLGAAVVSIERTIVCTDVVGFTQITERLGDRRALAWMQRLARIVRAQTRRQGGEELELQGDGFLLAFDTPAAGIACAVSIQRALASEPIRDGGAELELRIAVHTGAVLRDGDGYFGANMIVPYRLLKQTAGGEVVISSATRDRVEGRWPCTPLCAFLAKGFSQELHFCALEWRRPDAAAPQPVLGVPADLGHAGASHSHAA
jgi:class 3 adenylate cyclase